MIIDLARFIVEERPVWNRLEEMLKRTEDDAYARFDLKQIEELYYLYQKTSADLARVATFSAEPETRQYLESLVARAYVQVHETRAGAHRFSLGTWFLRTFPQTFRRHIKAFQLACAAMGVGAVFGALALAFDPDAKAIIMPFSHLHGNPAERVAREESRTEDRLGGGKARFSAFLMTHNTRVSIGVLALGASWGIGTIVMLFYNGVILGAVAIDYVIAGQTKFLMGWLLPHGAVEIPAILIAGQAGLVLGGALIGWGTRTPLRTRMREISPDLVTLIFGLALLLVWAGVVEGFISQYHEPLLPYPIKIGFGIVQLILLGTFLFRSGREERT